jgi:hypothetical protein
VLTGQYSPTDVKRISPKPKYLSIRKGQDCNERETYNKKIKKFNVGNIGSENLTNPRGSVGPPKPCKF